MMDDRNEKRTGKREQTSRERQLDVFEIELRQSIHLRNDSDHSRHFVRVSRVPAPYCKLNRDQIKDVLSGCLLSIICACAKS